MTPGVSEASADRQPLDAGSQEQDALSYQLELNKANRLRLARAFRHNQRVDYAIDCVVEGQMGQAFADDLRSPTAFRITLGPFWYFAGEANSPGGRALLREFPAHGLLMPSPAEWIAAAREIYHDRLAPITRYSFSPDQLSEAHLAGLLDGSPYRDRIVPLDASQLTRLAARPENYLQIGDFDSSADFLERGLGFAALGGQRVMGAAYSALVCSRGIEVSIYVEERFRERGVATALASRLLLECQRRGLRPNWDAANPESCQLAKKLGYVFVEAYEAYFHSAE
jgi:GNAT superfamily N-acetyltransferase